MIAAFRVRGRVQGVAYRAAARDRAVSLGLDGSAVNLDDGDVRVVASGEPDAVESLAAWLSKGPALARVDTVVREADVPARVAPGFVIG